MKQNKKIIKVFSLLLSTIVLSSCKDGISNLYSNQFSDENFMENYYSYQEKNIIDNINSHEIIDISDQIFAQSVFSSNGKLIGLKEEDQQYNGKNLTWENDTPKLDYGVGYGPTKNLILDDESFAYGYLSKLYDGRVHCTGQGANGRVQINSSGYTNYFPKELISYDYFGIALRGGTTYDIPLNTYVSINLNLSFYVYNSQLKNYKEITLLMNNVSIKTDFGGTTTFISFYFDELSQEYKDILKGSTGMSMSFSLTNESKILYPDLSDDIYQTSNNYFALMLYEFLLPNSTWL